MAPPPGPVEISYKKDGCQRRPHRFHVSQPPLPGCWIRYWADTHPRADTPSSWADIPPPPGQPPPPSPSDGHCSGRYASYWNAYLLTTVFSRDFKLALQTCSSLLENLTCCCFYQSGPFHNTVLTRISPMVHELSWERFKRHSGLV